MADASSGVLVDAILCDDLGDSASLLGEQLPADPPLLFWAVCRAWGTRRFRPRSVEDLAGWLAKHALDVFQWESGQDIFFATADEAQAERYGDMVAARLEIADMAALLSSSQGQAAAEEAFLAGSLREAAEWLLAARKNRGDDPKRVLPDWLYRAEPGSAAARVAEAVEMLAEKSPAGHSDLDPEGCHRRAQEGRRRWLEEIWGPGDRLPALTSKLARLKALQERFDEVLETEKLSAMAEFAAGAGHEINNPLAIIGGRAQLLLKDESDPERRRELALIVAQVKRAHEMIADIRLFARPPRPEVERVDLVDLVDRVVAELTPQVVARASTIRRTGEGGPLEIEADPAQIHVALRALCRNALEAIGHDGNIEIEVNGSDDKAVVRVSDNGPGILPEGRAHLFDPFYSSRQAGRGLGTGLSKCWRIVTGHGGTIGVNSEPGEGAAFTVTLPRESNSSI
jgi:signal transduction histidine kinase